MFLMKCYLMLQNARATVFTISELSRQNQRGGWGGRLKLRPPTQIRVKTLDYWSRDMFRFNFFGKGLGLASQPHFMHDFSKKCFSCYILLTNQISFFDWKLSFSDWNSGNIGQYVCYNCFFTRLWRHKFCIKGFY